jgi:branched-subunit amino acid aminotransferase/4-amino-4-deoxychorismate lyase
VNTTKHSIRLSTDFTRKNRAIKKANYLHNKEAKREANRAMAHSGGKGK